MLGSPEVLGRKGAQWLIKIAKIIPYLKYFDFGGAHRVFSLFIRNQIICIDDLERKGKNLYVGDVLGLINFLKEERNCKIALILNEDALYQVISEENKKQEFRRYFEKVVDISLNFDPTAEESVNIALKERTKEKRLISEQCIKLGISNIRIIKKIDKLVGEIAPILNQFEEQVVRKAVISLTLLSWSVYDPETAPPIEHIKKRTSFGPVLQGNENISEKEGAWNALLDAYGFSAMDEFDHALLGGIQNGFFDTDAINENAFKLNEQIRATNSSLDFWNAWGAYHDSFSDNQEEVLNTIYHSFRRNVQYLNPNDLNGTVCLLKELGKPDEAAQIIKYYIENRKGDRRFFDLDLYSQMFGQINDPDVITAFQKKYASIEEGIDPIEILLRMVERRGWSKEDLTTVSKLQVDDYYRIFKSKSGEELRSIISFCLQSDNITNPSPEMVDISKRTKEALRRIGEESPINARRVRKYHVNLDNLTPTE